MEERGHILLFPFHLSVDENAVAVGGAPAAILSHEIIWRMETIHAKTTNQPHKKKLSFSETMKYNLFQK